MQFVIVALAFASLCFAQRDSGVRGCPLGAGGPLPGRTQNEMALFLEGKLSTTRFFHFSFLTISIYGQVGTAISSGTVREPSGLGAPNAEIIVGRGGRSFVTVGPGEPGLLPPFVALGDRG